MRKQKKIVAIIGLLLIGGASITGGLVGNALLIAGCIMIVSICT